MHQGKLVFSQLMAHLPLTTFRRCVAAHRGEHKVKDLSCLDQFLAMAFAQLTWRESLRDIEVNLRAQAKRLYHMGFRCQTISRNTLANANATRPWEIYADFAQHLIANSNNLKCSAAGRQRIDQPTELWLTEDSSFDIRAIIGITIPSIIQEEQLHITNLDTRCHTFRSFNSV